MTNDPDILDLRPYAADAMPADWAHVTATRVDRTAGGAFTARPHPWGRLLQPGEVGLAWGPAATAGTPVQLWLGSAHDPMPIIDTVWPGNWLERLRPTAERALRLAALAVELATCDPDPEPLGELALLIATGVLRPGDVLSLAAQRERDGVHLGLVTSCGRILLPDGTLHPTTVKAAAHADLDPAV
ncbi:hypothetical protein [Streptacidiphilus albus]|uniref:hypothetical protein n=1 Tax=Streptacidiphilus albus TaxID=105425 RepID=UPI00054BB929|nr:hypothetical protein [Streptacidiphilus albus]